MLAVLDGISMPYCERRLGFPKFRGFLFGVSRAKFDGAKIGLSRMTRKYSDEWEFIKNWSYDNVPVEFNSIQVNNNLVCPPHKDKANVGVSFIISFGDYVGCDLVVDGVQHDTRKGLVFNGFLSEHYNTPLVSGNKYSLVFFKSALPHFYEFE